MRLGLACTVLVAAGGVASADPPHVGFDAQYEIFQPTQLPAISADGKRVVVLHARHQPETTSDAGAELRVIDVATDRIVERIEANVGDARFDDHLAAINARLGRGSWTPLVAGEVIEHCPHGHERDSDGRQCELRVGGLAVHYDDTRLRVTAKTGKVMLDRTFRAWGHPYKVTNNSDRGIEDSGLANVYVTANASLMLAIVTYHHWGDEERGSDDEEHLVRIR